MFSWLIDIHIKTVAFLDKGDYEFDYPLQEMFYYVLAYLINAGDYYPVQTAFIYFCSFFLLGMLIADIQEYRREKRGETQ